MPFLDSIVGFVRSERSLNPSAFKADKTGTEYWSQELTDAWSEYLKSSYTNVSDLYGAVVRVFQAAIDSNEPLFSVQEKK